MHHLVFRVFSYFQAKPRLFVWVFYPNSSYNYCLSAAEKLWLNYPRDIICSTVTVTITATPASAGPVPISAVLEQGYAGGSVSLPHQLQLNHSPSRHAPRAAWCWPQTPRHCTAFR